MGKLGVSERLACKVLRQHRSVQRKARSTADDEAALTADITDLAKQYGVPPFWWTVEGSCLRGLWHVDPFEVDG